MSQADRRERARRHTADADRVAVRARRLHREGITTAASTSHSGPRFRMSSDSLRWPAGFVRLRKPSHHLRASLSEVLVARCDECRWVNPLLLFPGHRRRERETRTRTMYDEEASARSLMTADVGRWQCAAPDRLTNYKNARGRSAEPRWQWKPARQWKVSERSAIFGPARGVALYQT